MDSWHLTIKRHFTGKKTWNKVVYDKINVSEESIQQWIFHMSAREIYLDIFK